MPITFLTGPAGTGKTTYAVERLRTWLAGHVPASSILVIVPQLTLTQPYRDLLRDPTLPGAGAVEILTLNGLALKTIDLFWPLGAVSSGFGRPHERPIFLNIEQAQYYLRQAIDPLLAQGYFDPNVVPITISLPRLMSQILDNLNKAALIGLSHAEVGARLAASLATEPGSRVALEHTQACVNRFREFCLARNLLDFSLRIETFYQHLWPVAGVQQYLTGRYRYLIVDNIEEDTPFAHTVLHRWLPTTAEALLVHDEEAGYRIFLGANWRTARQLEALADQTLRLTAPRVAPLDMLAFGERLGQILGGGQTKERTANEPMVAEPSIHNSPLPDPRRVFVFEQKRFYPQLIDWVIERVEALLAEGVSPGEIVVLAPFVSDALRFSFTHRLEQRGLLARSHRPSRPLSEEPAAKTMLTLARLAFPAGSLLPEPFDVTQALHQAIADLDLIRANLLTQVVYRLAPRESEAGVFTAFDQIEGDVRERISYQAGLQFDRLREWLQAVQAEPSPPLLDHFFSRLFGELLAQPGFGFHGQREAGEVAARLIDSARQFRRVAARVPVEGDIYPDAAALNQAYLETIEQGIAAAQYVRSWEVAPNGAGEAVLITPATTFLMSNRPVDYQFWLDAGSSGWWERIAQPLTHPYVLSADWEEGRPWTDEDEVLAQRDRLYRLVLGLTRRCRKQIFIVNSEIGEQGYEQRGQLLVALQQMLRQMQRQQ
ncbi:MAG: hypothetical protein AB1801_14680 [Chloroflexota bacterium]